MREPQNSPATDFNAGVQAGLREAASLIERLAVRVQRPAAPPSSTPQPAQSRPVAVKASQP